MPRQPWEPKCLTQRQTGWSCSHFSQGTTRAEWELVMRLRGILCCGRSGPESAVKLGTLVCGLAGTRGESRGQWPEREGRAALLLESAACALAHGVSSRPLTTESLRVRCRQLRAAERTRVLSSSTQVQAPASSLAGFVTLDSFLSLPRSACSSVGRDVLPPPRGC